MLPMMMSRSHVVVTLLLLMCVLLLVCTSRAAAGQPHAREDRIWKAKQTVCETSVCQHLYKDENMNCVNNCTSPSCYDEIYGTEPLEDGEFWHPLDC
jgi:hypothetical protein